MKWKLHSQTKNNVSSAGSERGHKSLFRKTALAVTLAIIGSFTLATNPAFALSQVCTASTNGSGNHLCVASADLNDGTAITGNVFNNVRALNLQYQGFSNNGHKVYRLILPIASNPQRCVGISSAGNATIRDCLGNSNNTNWQFKDNGDGTAIWINNSFSNGACNLNDCQLSSTGNGGDQLFVTTGASQLFFQRWTPQP